MSRLCIKYLIRSEQYNDTPSRSVPCSDQARQTNAKCGIGVTTSSVNHCLLNSETSFYSTTPFFPQKTCKTLDIKYSFSIRSKRAVEVTGVSKVTLQYKLNKTLASMFLNFSHLFFFFFFFARSSLTPHRKQQDTQIRHTLNIDNKGTFQLFYIDTTPLKWCSE